MKKLCILFFSLYILESYSVSAPENASPVNKNQVKSVKNDSASPVSAPKNALSLEGKSKAVKQEGALQNHLWKEVSFFSSPKLYYFTKNPSILISVQKEKPVLFNQISDLKKFIQQVEQDLSITLSQTSIRNKKNIFLKIKTVKGTVFLHSKSSYIDFSKQQVFVEEYRFYHKKISLYIVVHRTTKIKKPQAVHNFIYQIIDSNAFFSSEEKGQFINLISAKRGYGG